MNEDLIDVLSSISPIALDTVLKTYFEGEIEDFEDNGISYDTKIESVAFDIDIISITVTDPL